MASADLYSLIEFMTLAGSLTDDEYQTFLSQFHSLFNRSKFISILYNAFYQTRNKTHIRTLHATLTAIIHARDDDHVAGDDNDKPHLLDLTDLSSNTLQHTASYLSLRDLIHFERTNRFIATCCRSSNASRHLNHSQWFQNYLIQNHDSSINYQLFRNDATRRHSIDIR
eukprot:373053_1